MTDRMARLTPADPHRVRMYIAKIVSVDTVTATCVVDPGDGGQVDGVSYYGGAPIVGDMLPMWRFDGMLVLFAPGTT
jgi:hypothetical protein